MATETIEVWEDGVLVDSKTGTVPDPDARKRRARLAVDTGLAQLTTAAKDWASLTATERTAAQLVAVKLVVLLARMVLGRFDTDDQPDT